MLNNFTRHTNLVLKKGQKGHIIFQLAINYLLITKLRVNKWLKKISRPIVHYYALCWNEEKMLPFVFDYYGQFVDKFTIFDNYSTDKSEEIILSQKNAEEIKFKTDGFNDFVHIDIKNNCWKKSRGKADFVVVCDMDEFIFHPQMEQYLQDAVKQKISFFRPQGFEMYSKEYPQYSPSTFITDLVKTGIPSSKYGKCIIFDPHRVVEINYKPGAHECRPLGIIKEIQPCHLKMLHYKNLDMEQVIQKTLINGKRLSKENLKANFGIEYLKDVSQLREEFLNQLAEATKVI